MDATAAVASHEVGSGYVEGRITHPDGRDEVFRAATEDGAVAWMERRNEELKDTYGLMRRSPPGVF
jgi:hypothetical protein